MRKTYISTMGMALVLSVAPCWFSASLLRAKPSNKP